MMVSSWHTSSFLLLPSSLASNMLSPNMNLTSPPPVSSYGDEFNPTLDSAPVIGPPTFNIIHLTLHLIYSLHHNIPYIAFPEHLIKTFPLTSILTSFLSCSDLLIFLRTFPCFHKKQLYIPNSMNSPKNMIRFFLYMTSLSHLLWPLSLAFSFETYSLWPGFTRSLRLLMSPFTTCGVRWGSSVKD